MDLFPFSTFIFVEKYFIPNIRCTDMKRKNPIFGPFKCQYCEKIYKNNLSGVFSEHLSKEHNIFVENRHEYKKHSLLISSDIYLENKNSKIEYQIKTICRICDKICYAKTEKSQSVSISQHIYSTHSISMLDYVSKFPEEKHLLGIRNKRLFDITSNIDNQVECKICYKKMSRINNKHLSKHNITVSVYRKDYGNDSIVSKLSGKKSSIATSKMNAQIKENSLLSGKPLPFHSSIAIENRKSNNYEIWISKNFSYYKNNTLLADYLANKYTFECLRCFSLIESENKIPRCYSCEPKHFFSKEQKELYDFLHIELGIENIEENYRKIENTEFDLFLTDYSIAIEYDGLYWHGEISNDKTQYYHVQKTDIGLKHNISVFHIFSDEWIHKKDIVKFRLKNILKKTTNSIGARECIIREISAIESREFLSKYHIQGYVNSKIRLGAFFEDELISIMMFGNLRRSMGNKTKDLTIFELIRFATKFDWSVSGIGSKFVSFFVEKYCPSRIISYADKRWTPNPKHNFYIKSKFLFISTTKPNYWYTDYDNRFYRYGFRPQLLMKEGYDMTKFTEWEIMQHKGYDRVWDCGSHKYELVF